MPRLKNKTAIITGAGTGIGRAIARAFVREGAKVAIVGRRIEPLNSLARELASAALVCSRTFANRVISIGSCSRSKRTLDLPMSS